MEINVVRRCDSCGFPLQEKDVDAPGYVEPEVYESKTASDVVYCRSCYRKRHYNSAPAPVGSLSEGFVTMLRDAKASDSLIVYVIDLFSFETSFSQEIVNLIRGLPVMVVANKRDLLPKDADEAHIKEYVASRFKGEGIPVKAEDVVLTSLSNFSDISEAMALLEKKRRRHDAYIIGARMSGKSLFVSSFIRMFTNTSSRSISVSDYPGTDVRVMAIPLDDSFTLYDTPGTDVSNSYFHHLEPGVLAKIVPTKPIKGRKADLRSGDLLFAGGLALLEVTEGECKVTSYFAGDVSTKKGSIPKKGGTDALIRLFNRAFVYPRSQFVKDPNDFDAFELSFDKEKAVDVGIAGLGWWSLTLKKPTKVRIFMMKGIGLYVSKLRKVAE